MIPGFAFGRESGFYFLLLPQVYNQGCNEAEFNGLVQEGSLLFSMFLYMLYSEEKYFTLGKDLH